MKTCERKTGLNRTPSKRRRSLQALLLGAAVIASSTANAQVQENPFFAKQASKAAESAKQTDVPEQVKLNRPKSAPKPRPKRLPLVKTTDQKPPSAQPTTTEPKPKVTAAVKPEPPAIATSKPAIATSKPAPTVGPATPADSAFDAAPTADVVPNHIAADKPIQKPAPATTLMLSGDAKQSPTWRPTPAIDLPVRENPVRENPTIDRPVREAAIRIQRDVSPAAVTWLQSSTPSSQRKQAIEVLDRATQEYSVGAWASAEASVWEALRSTAEGIDIAQRNAGLSERGSAVAITDLQLARTAIREARDFAGKYGDVDAAGVKRIVRSHSTSELKNESADILATDAIDRYLNEARIRLSRLAAYHIEAAQAIDLLAAIYLGRNDAALLPNETSLCRRAALQGQPQNADLAARLGMQLADLGLDQEAKWALEHSLALNPTEDAARTLVAVMQRVGQTTTANRLTTQIQTRFPVKPTAVAAPAVTQLTPEQFASVSPPVMSETATTVQANVQNLLEPQNQAVRPASYRAVGDEFGSDQQPRKPMAQRLFNPLKKFW